MNKVLNREDVVFAKLLLNDGVRGKGEALVIDFTVSALID